MSIEITKSAKKVGDMDECAARRPKFIVANEPVENARALMMLEGVDHLVVVSKNPKGGQPVRLPDLCGILTWKTLGKYASESGSKVKHCMDSDPLKIDSETALSKIVPNILRREYGIIHSKNEIKGSLTVKDYARYLTKETEPFLHISEIELGLRSLMCDAGLEPIPIDGMQGVEIEKARKAGSEHIELSQLTFYNLIDAIRRNWKLLKINTIGKEVFLKSLVRANEIRNAAMHFRSHDIDDTGLHQLWELRKTVQVLLSQQKATLNDS